jgi:hypothetical protein
MQIILLANKVGWGVQSLGRVIQDQLNNEGHSVQTLYFEDVLTHAGCAHLEDLRKLYSSDILLGRENRVNQFIRSINEIDQTALDRLEQILDQNELEAYAELGTERQAQNAAAHYRTPFDPSRGDTRARRQVLDKNDARHLKTRRRI